MASVSVGRVYVLPKKIEKGMTMAEHLKNSILLAGTFGQLGLPRIYLIENLPGHSDYQKKLGDGKAFAEKLFGESIIRKSLKELLQDIKVRVSPKLYEVLNEANLGVNEIPLGTYLHLIRTEAGPTIVIPIIAGYIYRIYEDISGENPEGAEKLKDILEKTAEWTLQIRQKIKFGLTSSTILEVYDSARFGLKNLFNGISPQDENVRWKLLERAYHIMKGQLADWVRTALSPYVGMENRRLLVITKVDNEDERVRILNEYAEYGVFPLGEIDKYVDGSAKLPVGFNEFLGALVTGYVIISGKRKIILSQEPLKKVPLYGTLGAGKTYILRAIKKAALEKAEKSGNVYEGSEYIVAILR